MYNVQIMGENSKRTEKSLQGFLHENEDTDNNEILSALVSSKQDESQHPLLRLKWKHSLYLLLGN